MDTQDYLDGALIQHGSASDRIYLMGYTPDSRERLYLEMMSLAKKENYGKIFIKVPQMDEDFFEVRGFRREAVIPRYYPDGDCILMGKYLKEERKWIPEKEKNTIERVLEFSVKNENTLEEANPVSAFSFELLTEEHIVDMAALYARVFDSYPFPIHDPEYLRETMASHIYYFGCFIDDRLVGVSSAETDVKNGTAEMTDFAVLPDFRGYKLAYRLLQEMEEFITNRGFRVAYTIARAVSYGMNKTFANADYTYGGTLVNNTQISGKIESMNVWHKDLL